LEAAPPGAAVDLATALIRAFGGVCALLEGGGGLLLLPLPLLLRGGGVAGLRGVLDDETNAATEDRGLFASTTCGDPLVVFGEEGVEGLFCGVRDGCEFTVVVLVVVVV